MERTSALRWRLSLSTLVLYTVIVALLSIPLLASYSQPKLMLTSDYLTDFYPAGKLLVENRSSELYPNLSSAAFRESAFNHFVHQLLPDLPRKEIAVFMFSPLTALIFCPYSFFSPQISLMLWQLTSMVAFLLSIALLCAAVGQNFSKCILYCLLYLPIFHTQFTGQLGIIVGLLPLSLGYFLLTRQRLFLGGISWSLLLLKPQFLPIVLLVVAALIFSKRYRCALGFITGIALQVAITMVYLKPAVLLQWFSILKMSETVLSSSQYVYSFYLMTSLPCLLHFFPATLRGFVEIPVCLSALAISLHALWLSCKAITSAKTGTDVALLEIFVIGIAILPLTSPHFLFYDFSIFSFFVVLFRSSSWSTSQRWRLKPLNWLYLISINIYYIFRIVLFHSSAGMILYLGLFLAVMALLYYRLLLIVLEQPHPSSTTI